ncbi:trehalase-domain-containing protein [Dunaliella salina]|uniref:alpha,alpha-trehalase n=1 Tax=Dunaliella salina TaxID=3046 RepID=A0ABQ7GI75_DUNSA|nr:trehalase-domain-containing protein [Dunaliella salina]|eukprot:KAF5834315.1 trehalase-domain-containing protein [Dunaliella salina]
MLARDIATIAHTLNHSSIAQEFEALASQRLTSLHELMWSEQDGCWHDLLLLTPSGLLREATAHGDQQQQQLSCIHTPCDLEGVLDQGQQRRSLQEASRNIFSPHSEMHHPSSAQPHLLLSQQDMDEQGAAIQQPTTPSPQQNVTVTDDLQGSAQQQLVFAVQQLETCAASNWAPLWAGCCQGPASAPLRSLSDALQGYAGRAAEAVRGLRASGLLQPGGVMASTRETGQQWDAPNAWPPLQHMTIEGLAHSGCTEAQEMAEELAGAWLASNWTSYKQTSQMHEKYDARAPGKRGGGGEYTPQVGFGWTNGVVLDLLRQGYTARP